MARPAVADMWIDPILKAIRMRSTQKGSDMLGSAVGPRRISSGLSQWVMSHGKPYSIEIFREVYQTDWTVEVIDAIGKEIVWTSNTHDDAAALIGAIAQIRRLYS